ncbi:hypothetical protein FOG48_02533 [Hanseniaspora uvarum]|nr:hypothetical protein FOG48_02533 [Hanseniaspora uvarum]
MLRRTVINNLKRASYSSYNDVQFGNEARQKLLKGITTLADAVSSTLGPKGRNVIIEQQHGILQPKITKDGVTVAKAITLKDPYENLGCKLLQQVASTTNEIAGDGTTSATVLGRAIFEECVKNVAAGCNPMDLRRGTTLAVQKVIEFLEANKKEVTTSEEVLQVATISANGDHYIGKIISQAMEKVGKEGVINVETGNQLEDKLEIVEGMNFEKGWASGYFGMNANADGGNKQEFNKPLVFISEFKLTQAKQVLPAMELAKKLNKELIIIAEDVDGEALTCCVLNHGRNVIRNCAIKAPGFGDNRKNMLHDIAILTGGQVFSEDFAKYPESITPEDFGSCDSVQITKSSTLILGGHGDKSRLKDRVEYIKNTLKDGSITDYETEKLQERLAKLDGGVALIRIGGASDVEVGEKKDRYDDALNATRAAVEDGILPGGGTALLKATQVLNDLPVDNFDQKLGVDIIKKAITRPSRKIIENAGLESSVIVGKLTEENSEYLKNFNFGYDAAKLQYTNMLESGIIDPFKVVRTGLLDASGIATLLATTEVAIVDSRDPAAKKPGMPGMPGMM